MNAIPITRERREALTAAEEGERREYAARLRKLAAFDVTSEMVYFQARLDDYGETLLSETASETIAYLAYLVNESRWKRDLCAVELARRRQRNLLPAGGAVGLAPEFIENLKSRTDLVEVVESAGVALRKRGKEWAGLCPFHTDGTPSLSVNREKAVWHCHSCGAGGDVIAFLQKMNGEDFIPTVQKLCAFAGEEMPGGRR